MVFVLRGTRKVWRFILIGAVMLSACAPAKAPGCPKIRIGVILDNSNPAVMAQQKAGYDAAVAEINQVGIGQACQVEWVAPTIDQAASADVPQRDVQNLASQGAVAIIAPPADDGAMRVASMSQFFGVPVVIPAASGDEIITPGDNLWNFRINSSTLDEALAAFEMVRTSQVSFIANAAILFENTAYGESAAVAAGQAALRNNIEISVYQRFSPFVEDFKDIQEALVSKHPNVIYLISTQPVQAASILSAIQTTTDAAGNPLMINFMIGNGSAFTSPDFLYDSAGKVKADLENLIIPVSWDGNASRQGDVQCQKVSVPQSVLGSGRPLALTTVQAYVSLRLVADAVQGLTSGQTWTVNEQKVTDWMAMFDTPDHLAAFRQSLATQIRATNACQYGNVLWPVQFSSDGQNTLAPVLAQVIGGNLVVMHAAQ